MTLPANYRAIDGSTHPHPEGHRELRATSTAEPVTVTILLRRRTDGTPSRHPSAVPAAVGERPSREAFAAARGADPGELDAVAAFARSEGLEVLEQDAARRTVIVRGPAAAINKAFAVELRDYENGRETYRSHDGVVGLPSNIADMVEAVVGLTNRQVQAKHFSTSRRRHPSDPPNTQSLTPQQVAALYDFPPGDGAGQTVGLYEMQTSGPAGYAPADVAATLEALGDLPMPNLIDVPVDGVNNSGSSDGETGLDITVVAAIAPKATIAVYFAGGETQNMIHALQQMIHPAAGAPAPDIISISYGWGADDPGNANFSDSEYGQFTSLFDDAATKQITVFVSSGDSGAYAQDPRQAQVTYPSTDIWVTSCGGTTIGNVNGASFDEYVWNDGTASRPSASGGGVSARFPVPAYQNGAGVPARVGTGQPGRGVPDIAGNASENSGYLQVINGSPPEPVGGTSAVAPLYAGLIARINANLGRPVGYLNATLYALPAATFNDIVSPPGPPNNSVGHVTGYPAGPGWDACTGRGSVRGQALQTALANASASAATP